MQLLTSYIRDLLTSESQRKKFASINKTRSRTVVVSFEMEETPFILSNSQNHRFLKCIEILRKTFKGIYDLYSKEYLVFEPELIFFPEKNMFKLNVGLLEKETKRKLKKVKQ